MKARRSGAELSALLKQVGLTHQAVADALELSKETVDKWCQGQNAIRLASLGSLIKLLEKEGAPVEKLRELLVADAIGLGLDAATAEHYLGLQRVPSAGGAHIIVAWDLRAESQMLAVSEIRRALSAASRDAVVMDCCSNPALHRYYLEVFVPRCVPAGVVVFRSLGRESDLDAAAQRFAQLGVPAVYIQERPRTLPAKAIHLFWNEYELARAAGRMVAEAGHEDIGVVFFEGVEAYASRRSGFSAGLTEQGGRPRRVHELAVPRTTDAFQDTNLLLRIDSFLSERRPTAIFSASSLLVLTLLQALARQSGRMKSQPLFVVTLGCEGWITSAVRSLGNLNQMSLAMIEFPIREMASKVVEALTLLEGGETLPREGRAMEVAVNIK